MKRNALMLLTVGLTAAWIGCQNAADTATPNGADGDTTLVTLSVPNMT